MAASPPPPNAIQRIGAPRRRRRADSASRTRPASFAGAGFVATADDWDSLGALSTAARAGPGRRGRRRRLRHRRDFGRAVGGRDPTIRFVGKDHPGAHGARDGQQSDCQLSFHGGDSDGGPGERGPGRREGRQRRGPGPPAAVAAIELRAQPVEGPREARARRRDGNPWRRATSRGGSPSKYRSNTALRWGSSSAATASTSARWVARRWASSSADSWASSRATRRSRSRRRASARPRSMARFRRILANHRFAGRAASGGCSSAATHALCAKSSAACESRTRWRARSRTQSACWRSASSCVGGMADMGAGPDGARAECDSTGLRLRGARRRYFTVSS